jgi:hypothetical protein
MAGTQNNKHASRAEIRYRIGIVLLIAKAGMNADERDPREFA